MKSEMTGVSVVHAEGSLDILINVLYQGPVILREAALAATMLNYVKRRWNFESSTSAPSRLPPSCQPDIDNAKWVEIFGRPGWYHVLFTEGPTTKAFVEAQDRTYLSKIASSDPDLFLKEMTPREELSAADQALKLGLDLSLPHHQNLQREYATTVERLRPAAPAPVRGGAAAVAAAMAMALAAVPAPMPAAAPAVMSFKEIRYSELKLGRKLGTGGVGEVYLGTWRDDLVAIKKFKPGVVIDKAVSDAFIEEAKVMATHLYPRIAALYAVCLEPGNYSMVMQYYPKGSLYGWLNSEDPAERAKNISWRLRIRIAQQILLGFKFLHDSGLVHRDAKSPNILLDESYHAVVADFGLAKTRETIRRSTEVMSRFAGTPIWAAPEVYEGKVPTAASDLYSVGVIFLELATRQVPFVDAESPAAIMFQIMSGRAAELAKIPADTPAPFAMLIRNLIKNDPKERPTAEAALGVLGEVETLLAGR